MSIPDLDQPVPAGELATFGPGTGGTAASINYSVPLPGAHAWQRIVPLDLDPRAFVPEAQRAGTSLLQLGVVQGDQGRLTGVDRDRLAQLYRRALPASVRPSLRLVAEVGGQVEPLLDKPVPRLAAGDAAGQALLERRALIAEPDDVIRQRTRTDSYLDLLANREAAVVPSVGGTPSITILAPGIGTSIRPVAVDPVAPAQPRIALVETWELRAYLGDYGLGRTLQTFSLLPGERTTITIGNWRTDSSTREDASSIFDSSDTASQTRFSSALTRQSGAASQDQGGWAASVSTNASAGGSFFGLVHGDVSVSTNFAANHQEASQRWSSSVSSAAQDHASQVNNSRQHVVQESSSSTSASGATSTTVRELSNVNLRRVLNFVFRELNQVYETYVVLRDIQVAFYNGNPGSAEIVPLAEVGSLIRRYVDPGRQEDVARTVLTLCAERVDAAGDVVPTLQVGTQLKGPGYDWQPAKITNGTLDFDGDPLSPDVRWRFDPHAASKNDRRITGVVMSRTDVVLRTDNMVVEALLGQADALDPYACALQALDLRDRESEIAARAAETKRTTDALALVAAQPAGDQIGAWQKVFPDEPEIEVVPVAAVETNGRVPV